MIQLKQITAAVVHYRTWDLAQSALDTFRQFYPKMVLTIIDNSGFDNSSEQLYQWAKKDQRTSLFVGLEHYKHHGTGMDLAIHTAETPYVFLFDTDVIFKGSVIERMAQMCPNDFYAIGPLAYANSRGHPCKKNHPSVRKHIHPCVMLVNKTEYLKGPPFVRHGDPIYKAMNYLHDTKQTDKLIIFPGWQKYFEHKVQGTAGRYGYNLKLKKRKHKRLIWLRQ